MVDKIVHERQRTFVLVQDMGYCVLLTTMLLECIMWLFDKFCQEPIMRGKFGYLPVIWAVWLLGFIKTNERKALCNAIFYVDQLPAPPASAPPA